MTYKMKLLAVLFGLTLAPIPVYAGGLSELGLDDPEITAPVPQPKRRICGTWFQRVDRQHWVNLKTGEILVWWDLPKRSSCRDDKPKVKKPKPPKEPPTGCQDDCQEPPKPPKPPKCERPERPKDEKPGHHERVKGNNGWGNGDQAAPGRSRDRNNAENGTGSHRKHGQANGD